MFTFEKHGVDQWQIKLRGRRVGYCGAERNMPVMFLTPTQCKLTDDEKRSVIAAVIKEHGGGEDAIKVTPQIERLLHVGGKRTQQRSDPEPSGEGGDSEG